MNKVRLGDKVEDLISGFVGVVTCRSNFLTGCTRYQVEGTSLGDDGKPVGSHMFDETSLRIVQAQFLSTPPEAPAFAHLEAKLGQRCSHRIHGAEGVVTAVHEYIDGLVDFVITPSKPKADGSLHDIFVCPLGLVDWIDERPTIKTPHQTSGRPGGPQRCDPSR